MRQLLDCRSIDLSCVRFIAAYLGNAVIGTLGHSARRKPLQFATDSLLPANDAQACRSGWLALNHGDLNACNADRGGTREGSRIRGHRVADGSGPRARRRQRNPRGRRRRCPRAAGLRRHGQCSRRRGARNRDEERTDRERARCARFGDDEGLTRDGQRRRSWGRSCICRGGEADTSGADAAGAIGDGDPGRAARRRPVASATRAHSDVAGATADR